MTGRSPAPSSGSTTGGAARAVREGTSRRIRPPRRGASCPGSDSTKATVAGDQAGRGSLGPTGTQAQRFRTRPQRPW
jgi:hypothetical protein